MAGVTSFNCPNCGAAVDPDSTTCSYCTSAIAGRVCSECFGSIAVGMRHCPHCGARANAPASGRSGPFSCPRCEIGLSQVSVGEHELNHCPQCGGLWLDKDSFQEICSREEEQEAFLNFRSEPSESTPRKHRPKRTYVPCPECGKLMNHKHFSGCSGVVIDWCRDHGSWLDRAELQRIIAFIRNGGLRKAREREQNSLRERESRLRMREFQRAVLGRRLNPADEG